MRERFRAWRYRLRDVAGPLLTDFGTVLLGAAAIFLTRAFPEAFFRDFDPGMLMTSAACCLTGLALRFLSRP